MEEHCYLCRKEGILDAFEKQFRKATSSLVISLHPSGRMKPVRIRSVGFSKVRELYISVTPDVPRQHKLFAIRMQRADRSI